MAITHEELAVWRRYVHEVSGVSLDESKGYLLETRLAGLLREANAASFSELYFKAKSDTTQRLRRRIVDEITTNETSFFRDSAPFELLKHKLIPEVVDRRRVSGAKVIPIRIWSAACSTGQEAFSVGILLKELLVNLSAYDIRILGTDISDRAVAHASYGHYSQLEVERGLPPNLAASYFQKVGDTYKIRDEIRALATFRTMNLLEPFSFPVGFDLILCRNVAIYFSDADKTQLFRNLARALAPGGRLVIGATESIGGLCPALAPKRHLRTVFYEAAVAS